MYKQALDAIYSGPHLQGHMAPVHNGTSAPVIKEIGLTYIAERRFDHLFRRPRLLPLLRLHR